MALIAERPEREEEVLVAAVAGHDLLRLQTEVGCGRLEQVGTGGVGVKAQLFHLVLAHGSDHRRGGQIGAFVGVQFDVLLVLRLFARRIGGDSGQGRGKKTTHNGFLLLLIPDGHAAGVGVQALALGKIGDAGGYFAQRFPGVVEEAGLLYKVVYAQGA